MAVPLNKPDQHPANENNKANMPRDPVETIAALVARIKDGHAAPVDIMMLYKALRELPPSDASKVIGETTNGAYAVVPTEPPEEWNPVQKKAYRIFLKRIMEWMVNPEQQAEPH